MGAALAALALFPVALAAPLLAPPSASATPRTDPAVQPVGTVRAVRAVQSVRAAKASTKLSPLTVTLVRTSPWTPASAGARRLTFTVLLRNTTTEAIKGVVLRGYRGGPVTAQKPLTAKPADELPTGLLPIPARPTRVRTLDIAAGRTVTTTFRTTTGIPNTSGLCLCANAAYPVYLGAYDSRSGALDGFTRTFVASVDRQADKLQGNPYRKVGVAWLWPLIDRPHRLTDGRVLTDNGLATEIAPGRRLDRALQVVEDLGGTGDVPITVVIDPELVDELAVMASGHYTYLSTDGKSVRGTDGAAARRWLSRLRAALTESPSTVSVQFTPYADPALQSLTADGLTWQSQLPSTMQRRVEHALGLQTIPSSLSWPPGGVDRATLNRITGDGSTGVVLNATNVSPSSTDGVPSSLVGLHTSHGQVGAALLSAATDKQIAETLDFAHPDLSHLPDVLAQVAVRSTVKPYQHRVVLLSVPRYVDANPSVAERVIHETTTSAFSTPVSLDDMLTSNTGADLGHAHLRPLRASTPHLPARVTAAAESIRTEIPAVRSLLVGKSTTAAALSLVTALPRGLQRIESAGWQRGSTVGLRSGAVTLTDRLQRQVGSLLGGVRIVRPPGGRYTYTLASTNSPLPITVDNTLPYRAFVRIKVRSVAGLPGLSTKDLGVQPIAAQSKQTFRIPAYVTRSGRIQLFATLTTANGHVLGRNVRLSVHSTVYGTIGIVITVAAAVILFLALVLRYIRRLDRLRRKRQSGVATEDVPSTEPVA